MIRQVRGKVRTREVNGAMIDGGGWGVFLYMATTEGILTGAEVMVLTHMAGKQEGIELCGFVDPLDLQLFTMFLSVSGGGLNTALSSLTRVLREALEQAIGTRDITYLTRVAGLGKKAAEKLAVELSEKIEVSTHAQQGTDAEVFDTLVALGYTDREARKALASIPLHAEGRAARLKAALSTCRS